jgi:hypothetical protein
VGFPGLKRGGAAVDLNKLLKQIRHGFLHVMIAGRRDGLVGILYTRDPVGWCKANADELSVQQVEVRASAMAERAVCNLRALFAQEIDVASVMPWYRTAFASAVEALDFINLHTGAPYQGIELNAPVYVPETSARGRVVGFADSSRVIVKLCRTNRLVEQVVIVPRDQLKLVVRTPAIGTAKG